MWNSPQKQQLALTHSCNNLSSMHAVFCVAFVVTLSLADLSQLFIIFHRKFCNFIHNILLDFGSIQKFRLPFIFWYTYIYLQGSALWRHSFPFLWWIQFVNVLVQLAYDFRTAHQVDSNATLKPLFEFKVFHLFTDGTSMNQDITLSTAKAGINLKLRYRLWGYCFARLFSWQCQNFCGLSLAFISDCRVVKGKISIWHPFFPTIVYWRVVLNVILRT